MGWLIFGSIRNKCRKISSLVVILVSRSGIGTLIFSCRPFSGLFSLDLSLLFTVLFLYLPFYCVHDNTMQWWSVWWFRWVEPGEGLLYFDSLFSSLELCRATTERDYRLSSSYTVELLSLSSCCIVSQWSHFIELQWVTFIKFAVKVSLKRGILIKYRYTPAACYCPTISSPSDREFQTLKMKYPRCTICFIEWTVNCWIGRE